MDAATASPGPGFVVIYRWRLHPGSEDSFIAAWSKVSELLRSERGSLGSRLHRGPDGIWYSYAQWPSSQVRDDAFSLGSVDQQASEQMAQALAERLPDIALESIADFMLPIVKNGT